MTRRAPAPRELRGTDESRSRHHVLDRVYVLVVEDDPDSRALISRALRGAGARVMDVPSATDALRALTFVRPDVIISDVAMPAMSGLELIRRVRRLAASAGGIVPAIAVTAFSSHEDRQCAIDSGFDEFLPKPLQLGALITMVKELLCDAHVLT